MIAFPNNLRAWTLLLAFSAACAALPAATNYYVDPVNGLDTNGGTSTGSPFKTLAKARDAVRSAIAGGMTQDVVVNLRGGRHVLTTTLDFTDADSGRNGWTVVWRAYNDEQPIIDGGKQVTGWTLKSGTSDVWQASVPTGSGFPDRPRNLWIDGSRRTRARGTFTPVDWWPRSPSYPSNPTPESSRLGVVISSSAPASYAAAADMEGWWSYKWVQHRLPVASVALDAGQTAVTFSTTPFTWTRREEEYVSTTLTLENAYELMDTAGEWYLDRSTRTLFYKQAATEDITNAAVYLPVVDGPLFRLTGSSTTARISNLRFEGLTFRHTNTPRATLEGAAPAQSNKWADRNNMSVTNEGIGYMPPQAVEVSYAENLVFSGNHFVNLGTGGLGLIMAVRDSVVTNNVFRDTSDAALTLSTWNLFDVDAGEAPVERITVAENTIRDAGAEFYGACGISSFYTQDSVIRNNDLALLPYTGIQTGWGFSSTAPNASARNRVTANRISGFMNRLLDGGGIYSLGWRPSDADKDIWSGNHINDMNGTNGALYPDEYSSHILLDGNVTEELNYRWIHIHTSSIQFITATNNFSTTSNWLTSGTNCTINAPTVYTLGSRPAGANAIVNAAGVPAASVSDDFADGTATDWMTTGGTWSVFNDGGNSVFRQSATNTTGNALSDLAGNVADFDLTFRIKPTATGSGGTPNAGIAFRYHDDNNFYLLVLQPTLNQIGFSKKVAGTWSTVATAVPFTVTLNAWHSIRVVARGQQIQVFNATTGATLFNVAAEPSLSVGKIGLRNYLTAANYDDIVLVPSRPTLYADDFTDGNVNNWSVTSGTWAAVADAGNNAYEQSSTSGEAISVSAGTTHADGLISARVKITGGTGSGAGIIFRYRGTNNHYLAYLQKSDNTLRLYRRVNATTYTSIASAALTLATNTWYQLDVEMKGNVLKASVGNVTVTATDDNFVYGRAGVRTNGISARFDDLVILP